MDNDMLSSLLNDPEALQNAMQAVSGMLGSTAAPASPPAGDYDPTADMVQRALPVIGAFVTDEVAGQFAHALRLVSMARMARAAMGELGHLGRPESSPPAGGDTPQPL